MKRLVTFTICGLMLAACSNEQINPLLDTSQAASPPIDKEQVAARQALDFVSNFATQTRSLPFDIAQTKVIALTGEKIQKLTGANTTSTRALNDKQAQDTLLYIVNFGANRGFSIVSATNEDNPVLAYIEEGSFSADEEITNPGFRSFLAGAASYPKIDKSRKKYDKMIDESDPNSGRFYSYFRVMKPLLHTTWNQTEFNNYVRTPYAGCVPIAMAQIASYIGVPSAGEWVYEGAMRKFSIDWNDLHARYPKLDYDYLSTKERDDISMLVRYLGYKFDSKYKEKGTSTNSAKAVKAMSKLGCKVGDLRDYKVTEVVEALKEKKIVYMSGAPSYHKTWLFFKEYDTGHAWVVDGYIESFRDNDYTLYLHCNWGWGHAIIGKTERNGYYRSNCFNSDLGPAYTDSITTRSGNHNYKYNLKTAIFTK